MAKYIREFADNLIRDDQNYVHFGHGGGSMSVVQMGWHKTKGGYGYGPLVRDHWLLHFVYKGQGIVKVENMEYDVGKYQIFAIRPHQITYYESSADFPWEYYYVGFEGEWAPQIMKCIGFTEENIIVIKIPNAEEVFAEFQNIRTSVPEYIRTGKELFGIYSSIYKIFQILSDNRSDDQVVKGVEKEDLLQNEYTNTLISIINTSFSEKLNIQEIAKRMNLNRSYLSEIFKRDMGRSIKSYLTDKRMQWAIIMLQSPERSIKNIAVSCGFDDPLYFSRAFRKYYGISPQEYRKRNYG